MLGWTIVKWLAVLTLFSGIIGTFFYNTVVIIGCAGKPCFVDSIKTMGIDIGKVFLNSQEEIKVSIEEFKTAETGEYKNFMFSRIAGATIISVALVFLAYKGLSWFVPGKSADLGTKLLLIILSFIIVYAVGLITSIIIGKGFVAPFSGWWELVVQRQVIIDFILSPYA